MCVVHLSICFLLAQAVIVNSRRDINYCLPLPKKAIAKANKTIKTAFISFSSVNHLCIKLKDFPNEK